MAFRACATPIIPLNEWKPFRRADVVVLLNQSSALERTVSLSADPLPQ